MFPALTFNGKEKLKRKGDKKKSRKKKVEK